LPVPPQETRLHVIKASTSSQAIRPTTFLVLPPPAAMAIPITPKLGSQKAYRNGLRRVCRLRSFIGEIVAVTVSLELTTWAPGVTELGTKEQLTPTGSPEQESATAPVKEPEMGVTVTFALVERPDLTCRAAGDAPSEIDLGPFEQCGV